MRHLNERHSEWAQDFLNVPIITVPGLFAWGRLSAQGLKLKAPTTNPDNL